MLTTIQDSALADAPPTLPDAAWAFARLTIFQLSARGLDTPAMRAYVRTAELDNAFDRRQRERMRDGIARASHRETLIALHYLIDHPTA
jgi:hypothetical protein